MRTPLIVGLSLLLLAGVAVSFRAHLADSQDRGLHGQDLRIPGDFVVEDLGEVPLERVAESLRGLVRLHGDSARVAVTFTEGGAEIQVLVDAGAGLIDLRRASSAGTLVRELWHGPVRPRLDRAASDGEFEVPGMPPVERRNLYH